MDTIQIDVSALSFAVGVVIPLLVALIVKWRASPKLKAVMNLLLSGLAGAIVVAIQADGEVQLSTWVVALGTTWVSSIISYVGLWKPTEVAPAVAKATADFGIGSGTDA